MSKLELWFIILAVGLIAFALRYYPMVLLERFQLPPLLQQALRYVPAATLAGIVIPEFLTHQGHFIANPLSPRLIAGVMALFLAWRFKNVILTLLGGMGTLWILKGFGL